MKQKHETEKGLVINIPFPIKQQIDSQFSGEYSQKQIDKIYFIVYKICKEKNYQINIKNHSEFFGLKTGQVCDILYKLSTMLIIATTGDYRVGAVSNSYKLVTKYNCISDENYKLFFYESNTDLPLWVRKYLADGYTIKATKHSNFKKNAAVDKDKIILQLENKVKQLEAELALLKGLQPETNSLPVKENIVEPKPLFVAPEKPKYVSTTMVIEPDPLIDGMDIFSRRLSNKTYYYMNYSIVTNAVSDDAEESLLLDKLTCSTDGDNQCFIFNGKNIKFNKGRLDDEVMIELVA